jgi:hypothetical protein
MDAQVEREPGAWKLDATHVVIRHNCPVRSRMDIDLTTVENYRIYDNVCPRRGPEAREGFARRGQQQHYSEQRIPSARVVQGER